MNINEMPIEMGARHTKTIKFLNQLTVIVNQKMLKQ